MEGYFMTDRGQVRSHNEDSGGVYRNAAGQILAVIADGMGGHQAGDVASQMATAMIEEEWQQTEALSVPERTEAWLIDMLNKVNKTIYEESVKKEECKGMGTTIVIVICTEDFFTVAHIGDSRCYLFNNHGFKQITEDHSLVNALIQTGQISPQDAKHHPRKNIVLKALGTEEQVEAEVQSVGWEKGDTLLLCSDGLSDKVEDEELSAFIESGTSLKKMGQSMIDLANERGGDDNVSLVILHHKAAGEAGETSC